MADQLPIAATWFERRRVDDSITLLSEPHVIELMRCNIWHVQGHDCDIVIDTGMGIASVVDALDLADRQVTAVATHGHDDHIGGHHEFDDVVSHRLEHHLLLAPPLHGLNPRLAWDTDRVDALAAAGFDLTDRYFVTALPEGTAVDTFRQQAVAEVRIVEEGDVISTGDRAFQVLHLPGHSPGSIGLWEETTGTLFSGDAIYDGQLIDQFPESSIADYSETMERLMRLPIQVVHAGHDASFGRDRLHEIARGYLTN